MFLSYLLVELGDNPDRPHPGRHWIRKPYRVHQRLCMAFPSKTRKSGDTEFLQPFDPNDFAKGHVHTERSRQNGFLFRIDPKAGGSAMLLVQSAIFPDWDYAFQNASFLLAGSPMVKQYEPSFKAGDRLRFRLLANPTKRISNRPAANVEGKSENVDSEKPKLGKRVPIRNDELMDWISRKAMQSGFDIERDKTDIQTGFVQVSKSNKTDPAPNGKGAKLRSVRFDGVLTVLDEELFNSAIANGIGSGKSFGFGLLSVVPFRTNSKG